jgi:peptide/nickel transport system permease protein
VIVFVLMRAIPGDPAQLMLGDLENPRALEQLRRDLGLDSRSRCSSRSG